MKIEMVGKQFGSLEVITFFDSVKHHARWVCKCLECKEESIAFGHHLRSGHRTRCTRCQHGRPIHGKEGTQVYRAWTNMKQRCLDSTNPSFKNYGGRGIKIFPSWLKFECFFADMGDPPSSKHTLERKENDGNYEPENCEWATREKQALNKRNSFPPVFVNGEPMSCKAVAKLLMVTPKTIRSRYKKGMTEYQL